MKNPTSEKNNDIASGGGLGMRHAIVVILCACLTVNYIIRVNLSVAVVVMTNPNRTDGYPIFDWSPEQNGLLLSSFFVGYLVSNFIAGVFVTRYSNKLLLLLSVTFSSAASVATPVLVTWGGFAAMCAIRASLGLVQGFMMPVTTGLLSKWVPPNERSRCGTVTLGGLHLGTIISFACSGYLGDSPYGWPSVFYGSGLLSGLWCLLWLKYGADHPNSCKMVSEKEKEYINAALSGISQPDSAKKVIPWKKIFTNKPFFALALCMIGQNWAFWILITQIPNYFANVLKLDSSQNGTLAALPYVCLWILSFPISYLSDYIVSRKVVRVTTSRKMFNTIGQWGAAIALVSLAYTTSPTTAVAIYTIGVTLLSCTYVGFNINTLDISPNYSGLLMGLTNGLSLITAIAGPAFVGMVVKPLDNAEGWKLVFLVAAAFIFAGNTIFITFGSAEVQEFNNIDGGVSAEDAEKSELKPLNN